jgi:O-antigen/teichoic acid export membrane protein
VIGHDIVKRYLNSASTRHAIALGMGTALGQLAVTIASPIWSRLYEPADFGRYGLMIAYLTTGTAAVSLRYDLAIPLARNDDESIRLVILSLFCAIPVALCAGGIFFWFTSGGIFGFGRLPAWSAAFVMVSLTLTSIYSTLRFWHVRNSDFSAISTSLVSQGVGRALTPIGLAPLHPGWLGLIAGELLGRTLGIWKLAQPLVPLVRGVAANTSMRHLGELLRHYRQYPLVFLPSSVLDAASGVVALPIMVALFGVATGGEFLLAQQIVMAPAAFIGGSLRDVIHSRLVPCARDNPAALIRIVRETALKLLLLATAIYLPLACLAPILAAQIFGRSWATVGPLVSIMCPAAVVMVAVMPISRAMVFSRVPQIKIAADLVKLILPAGGLIVGAEFKHYSLTSSVIGFTVLTGLSYAWYFRVIMYSIRESNQLPLAAYKPLPTAISTET